MVHLVDQGIAHRHRGADHRADLHVQARSEVVLVVGAVVDQSVFHHRRAAHEVAEIIRATGHVDVVVRYRGGLEHQVLPIVALSHRRDVRLGEGRLRQDIRVHQVLVVEACPLAGVHQIQLLDLLLETVLEVVRHVRLAGLALLRGDQHHAVRATRAVDGGGGSVFQDFHGLDVVGVDRRRAGRDAVDDVKRVVIPLDGVHAADAYRVIARRVARVLREDNARHAALQRLDGVGYGEGRDLVRLDGRHGAGQVFLLHRSVADDDHLVQSLQVLAQHDLHLVALAPAGIFQRRVADIGYLENRVRGDLDGEFPVDVRHDALRRPLHQHIGPDNRDATLIHDRTAQRVRVLLVYRRNDKRIRFQGSGQSLQEAGEAQEPNPLSYLFLFTVHFRSIKIIGFLFFSWQNKYTDVSMLMRKDYAFVSIRLR